MEEPLRKATPLVESVESEVVFSVEGTSGTPGTTGVVVVLAEPMGVFMAGGI